MTEANPTPFTHLHVHTQYSLLDGAIRIDALLGRVRKYGMTSVAITDHGTMFGVLEFYKKAIAADIHPVIGCECYLAPRTIADKTPADHRGLRHLVLLAENQQGYRNLCRIATIAQLEGFYYKPRIDRELLGRHAEGLIALSACLHGEIPMLIGERRLDAADAAAQWYLRTFGEKNFFLEIQNNGIDAQEAVNEQLQEMSARLSIPLVASNDCHYLQREDVRAHEVLLCIQTGKTVNDEDRFKFRTDQLYLKSPAEMQAAFGQVPGALENSFEIARRCQVEFEFGPYHFPQFAAGKERSVEALFEEQVRGGYRQVMEKIAARRPSIDRQVYDQRLEYEIGVILKMGFAGYFLIVADFIRYAKENGIPVGPGRGSAAGSMVAYSLGITDLDPLEHGLIFERFLNPDRISMPDIDVDFCINGREQVFRYVVDRYGGGDYVAQIITFGKLKTRAVIRDVGRALDIPLRQVDELAKMVPDVLNISLEKALKTEPRILELAAERGEIAELIDICRVLEGLPRHASTHAAGVVIGDRPLVEYMPLYRGKKGEILTQFDMDWVERIGLVKFDFLGLRNLTVIDRTLQLIADQGQTPPDISNLDLNDADTYRLLAAGDTTGVFQLESSGIKDLMVRLRPECFDDIIALVALYRPGPLNSGMADEFVERKHGRKAVTYLLPQLEPILQETYGVIVYQEQVMRIAGELARYSMADADGLRKAMGKKITALMAKHRQQFIAGATANEVSAAKARELFDLMEKFAEYGFNKSHSAAYALIAFQTAYLKAHHPVELLAALLTSAMHSVDDVVKFMAECRAHAIAVRPPDINEGGQEFVVRDGEIIFGLVAVKNVGEGAIEAILDEREQAGRFQSLFDFCERADLRRVNKRVLESLVKCGAFDSTGSRRSQMMAALDDAVEHGQRVQKERCDPQMGLFGGACSDEAINPPPLPAIEEWDDKQRLAFEKESLGFFVSGHPLSRHDAILEKFATTDTLAVQEAADRETVRIGGLVQSARRLRTKKGDPMAFVQIEDMQGTVEVIVFPDVYGNAVELLEVDTPILIQGQVQREEKTVRVVADAVVHVKRAEETWTTSVHLRIETAGTEKAQLTELQQILRQHPGSCKVFVHLCDPQGTETVVAVNGNTRIRAGAEFNRAVNGLLGYPAVRTACSAVSTNGTENGRRHR